MPDEEPENSDERSMVTVYRRFIQKCFKKESKRKQKLALRWLGGMGQSLSIPESLN
jgi:fructose-1,6-bisphosphatase